MIATWKLDLNRILHVFNVCSVGSVLPSLTPAFQTELAINTHGMVLDIHHSVVKGHEGTDSQRGPVSATFYQSTTEHSPSLD